MSKIKKTEEFIILLSTVLSRYIYIINHIIIQSYLSLLIQSIQTYRHSFTPFLRHSDILTFRYSFIHKVNVQFQQFSFYSNIHSTILSISPFPFFNESTFLSLTHTHIHTHRMIIPFFNIHTFIHTSNHTFN